MSIDLFQELFKGRRDAYGVNQFCLKSPLTKEVYEKHIKGDQRIGVYAIFEKKLTNFIVIDIDKPDFSAAQDFFRKAKHFNLNAYIERSKSKGFHCLLPGQKIITKEGYRNIEDIKVGEYVLTHRRRFKKVTQVFKHPYSGKVYEFNLNYTPEKILLTEDHRCLTQDFGWRQAKEFKIGDKFVFPIQKSDGNWNRFNLPKFEKTTHRGIENDYVITQKTNITDLTNPKLWWLVGLYLAEGSLYNQRKNRPRGVHSKIIFVIGRKEEHLLNKFVHYYKELYPGYKVHIEKSIDNAQRFSVSNRHLFEIIKLFGRVKNKHLPRWIMNLNAECRKQLFAGYFCGDGHFDTKGQSVVTSVCLDLLRGFQELLFKTGEISSIQKHSSDAYRLTVLNHSQLGQLKYVYGSPRYFFPRIKDIKAYNQTKQSVYNLEVEEDNSYVTSLGTFHNCWIFFDKPALALEARLVVELILKEINLKCEIFPKQDEVRKEEGFGNFIFLPLFGGDIKDGKTVFVNLENEVAINRTESLKKIKRTSVEILKEIIQVNNLKREVSEKLVSEEDRVYKKELPCIEKIKQGIKRGHRNECAFRLVIHLKEKGLSLEEVLVLILEWNKKNEAPTDKTQTQTENELLTIIKSVFKGDYKSYGCDSGIIAEYCDREHCPLILAQDKKAQIEKGLIVLVFRDPSTMVFRKKDYEYRLSNFEFAKSGKFKCSVTLSKDEALIFKDTISLEKAAQRRRFVNATKDLEVDKDLIKIDDLARRQIEKEEKEALKKPKQLYVMTEIEKNEALKFLEETPTILTEIVRMTDLMGVVGEEALRLMIYLCFTSRITAEPLSITIKGETSSGKSFIPTKVKILIPEEGCFFITRATANAFYHLPEDGMQHKIIFINELPGSESADYSIRTAQSEGNLILWMPVKDRQTGEMTTETKIVKGPVGFLLTTTKASLFDENETRNFSLFTDDSAQLTKRVGEITIRKAKGEMPEIEAGRLNLFKNFQRLLNPDYKVIMPFAEEVFRGFPDKPVRIRRDKERFRILIEIITLLHQFHRKQYKKNGKTFLEATLADYYLAKLIAGGTLLETIYEVGPSSKQVWAALLEIEEQYYKEHMIEESFEFEYRDLMDKLDWKYEKVKKWTLNLLRGGFIRYAEGSTGGRGKTARFTLTKRKRKHLTVGFLPTLKGLFEKYPCDKTLFYNPVTEADIDWTEPLWVTEKEKDE